MGTANSLDVSSVDAELQRVVAAWAVLPEAIKRAIGALVAS
jgi:hypothetical protein